MIATAESDRDWNGKTVSVYRSGVNEEFLTVEIHDFSQPAAGMGTSVRLPLKQAKLLAAQIELLASS